MSVNSVSLLPLITEFTYSAGLSIPWEQINQPRLATSSHQQDNDTHVFQWQSQTKGWLLDLVAMETDGGSNGAVTAAEYEAIMSVLNVPQVLTLNYKDILTSQPVMIIGCGLRPQFGAGNYNENSLFVGPINLKMI